MATKVMRTRQDCMLRDGPGLHGAGIEGARIYAFQTIVIDDAIDDGWVLVVGPNPPVHADGTYLNYGKRAWIEYAHLEDISSDVSIYKFEVNWKTKTVRLV